MPAQDSRVKSGFPERNGNIGDRRLSITYVSNTQFSEVVKINYPLEFAFIIWITNEELDNNTIKASINTLYLIMGVFFKLMNSFPIIFFITFPIYHVHSVIVLYVTDLVKCM